MIRAQQLSRNARRSRSISASIISQGLAWHPDGNLFVAAIAPLDGAASPEGSRRAVTPFDGSTAKAKWKSLFPDGYQPLLYVQSITVAQSWAAGKQMTVAVVSRRLANCVIHVWTRARRSKEVASFGTHWLGSRLPRRPQLAWHAGGTIPFVRGILPPPK